MEITVFLGFRQGGIINEAEAIKAFVQATGHTVEDSGFWLDQSGILAASRDGTNCVLEVKRSFTQRHSEMAEAVKSKDFCLDKNETGDSLTLLELGDFLITLYWGGGHFSTC